MGKVYSRRKGSYRSDRCAREMEEDKEKLKVLERLILHYVDIN